MKADTLMAARVVAVDSATVHTKNSENDLWTPVIDELNAFGENGGNCRKIASDYFFLGSGGRFACLAYSLRVAYDPDDCKFFLETYERS